MMLLELLIQQFKDKSNGDKMKEKHEKENLAREGVEEGSKGKERSTGLQNRES